MWYIYVGKTLKPKTYKINEKIDENTRLQTKLTLQKCKLAFLRKKFQTWQKRAMSFHWATVGCARKTSRGWTK